MPQLDPFIFPHLAPASNHGIGGTGLTSNGIGNQYRYKQRKQRITAPRTGPMTGPMTAYPLVRTERVRGIANFIHKYLLFN